MARYVELMASIKRGDLSDPASISQFALHLDADLEQWRLSLPSYWSYTVAASLDDSERYSFNGTYHIYSDPWICRMWDHYRWMRILVHELILSYLPSPRECILRSTDDQFLEIQDQQQASASLSIISSLATDICTSIASTLYRLAPQPPCMSGSTPGPPRVGGIFMVLWTLRIAGGAMGVPAELHRWAVQVLERIGSTMGILQTRIVIVRMNAHRDEWMRRMGRGLGNGVECGGAVGGMDLGGTRYAEYRRDVESLSGLVVDLD
jgi:hypothetical protein